MSRAQDVTVIVFEISGDDPNRVGIATRAFMLAARNAAAELAATNADLRVDISLTAKDDINRRADERRAYAQGSAA